MDREQFWAPIEAAKAATGSDCKQQAAQLVAALRERSVSDVLDYHHIHAGSWPSPTAWSCGERLPDQRWLL
jgi:Protein of unknown function (DUF4240)